MLRHILDDAILWRALRIYCFPYSVGTEQVDLFTIVNTENCGENVNLTTINTKEILRDERRKVHLTVNRMTVDHKTRLLHCGNV